jgi:hypothetical protein
MHSNEAGTASKQTNRVVQAVGTGTSQGHLLVSLQRLDCGGKHSLVIILMIPLIIFLVFPMKYIKGR